MEKYLARLTFKVEVDGKHDHFDEQVRLIESDDAGHALQAAERLGRSQMEEFIANDGAKVSWIFEGITSCTELAALHDGALVLGNTIYEQDIDGYRAYVRARWRHLAGEPGEKTKAGRLYHI